MDRANRFYRLDPRVLCASVLVGGIGLACFAGCSSWMSKNREKDNQFVKDTKRIQQLMVDPTRPRLIGEVANSLGMRPDSFDAFAVAASLPGTGGIVRPGVQRDWILSELRVRAIDNPEGFLDDKSTALVKLHLTANPCDNKGDIVDVAVENSTESLATNLTEGYVLESRLAEIAMLKGQLHSGPPMATASGEIVILPASYTRQPEMNPLQGVLIGGAKLKQDQPLGLRIESEFRHVIVTKAIEKAINDRYFFKDSSRQKMVAEGTSDWYVAITAVPKYKHDAAHFMSVIKCTGFAETVDEQQERLHGCKKLLMDPATSRRAAAELEAIGSEAAKAILINGLTSANKEVRFYAAYSLSYLDSKESIPVLVELAQTTREARALCLTGLVVNEDSAAREALEQLLQEPDADLRFGAFRAIRLRNPTDLTVKGEAFGKNFQFVQVPSSIPLLTVSLQKQKEVVLFGNEIAVSLFASITPTPLLTLSPMFDDQVKIAKKQSNGETRSLVVSKDIVSILRGLASIQATYNDVVHTLDQLALNQALASPLAINPQHIQNPIADAANKVDTSFEESKEVTIAKSMVHEPSSLTSKWLSTIGLRKMPWSKASKSNGLPEEPALDKDMSDKRELSDDELSATLNR